MAYLRFTGNYIRGIQRGLLPFDISFSVYGPGSRAQPTKNICFRSMVPVRLHHTLVQVPDRW